jgi:uncharacterized transporter YbjL
MEKGSNAMMKAIGLALLVAGLGLAYWGHQLSGSLTSHVAQKLTGALPNQVMYRYVGGAASAVAGLFLLAKK